ncbi:(2Fe-2S)-binding protein [Peribacillus cavernae]|uniref:(2Fe-2S)-binding protein n=1 Tax=Peribacillus cavernae TaxID=1674310 RepID=A0A3S0VF89_9BACI|nr:(2Fe-2S)-binding protein [Peribacillus cavernae]MDQ0218752.1 carbon-monoxide dehydrogenase small subunit [Peribacillus cavernae]RUQ30964.1 (2Fe-2S)-binding protein [Peribacillus cavernae]
MKKQVNFTLNGKKVTALVSSSDTLLEVLRNQFHLYGARESCALGLCGVCTLIVSGNPVSGCLYLAPMVDGEEVLTVEGLESEGELHPVQQAFYEKNAFQCGYCTSGMILMAKKLLDENPNPSEEEIKDYMAGNICRCASYKQIIEAINEASKILDTGTNGVKAAYQ